MPFLAIGGTRLHYESRGRSDGVPILFLHGLGSSSADWAIVLPAFDKHYHVVLADLPGHGQSEASPSLSIDAMAEQVDALLETIDARPAHVIGLSLGGCVALALALRSSDRVRSLTLVNAFARLRPAGAPAVLRLLIRAALLTVAPMTVVASHVARGLFPHARQRDLYLTAVAGLSRTPRRVYRASARALLGFDVVDRLGAITRPTLVIAGAEDRTVPLAAKEALARGIPDARLVVLPGSGHATPFDAADAFAEAVLGFVSAH